MPHGEEFSNTLLVKAGGSAVPDDVATQLVHGYVDSSSGVPDLFVLRYNDPETAVLQKGGFEIGTEVELSMQSTAPGGPQTLLSGEVTAVEVEVTEAGVQTVVRGLDVAHRLYRGTRVQAYLDMTASDIVRRVADRVGIDHDVDATRATLKHTTQANESDWDFLARLAAEHDRVLTVAEGKLHFSERLDAEEAPDSTDARRDPLVVAQGVNLLHLRATVTSSGQVPEVEVRGWNPQEKEAVVAKAPAETRSARLESGTTPTKVASAFDSPALVLGTPNIAEPGVAESYAESLADHAAGGFAEVEGTVRGNPTLRAGAAVKLVGVGDPFQGRYVLTSVHHDFHPDTGYRTTFVASNKSERSLFGSSTAGDHNGIGDRGSQGLLPAVVTSAQDPESRGRVKVKIPWLSEDYESPWARVLQLGAGSDRGMVWLPEVGDEVLASFAQGDLGHPVIIGGLYNGRDEPHSGWGPHVDSNNGAVIRRALVSRTGMLVEFLEKAGEERLVISTNNGEQKILLNQTDKGIDIVSQGPVSIDAQQEVKVVAQRDVTFETSGGNLELKATNITIEASANLELKGVTATIEGTGTAGLKAPAVTVDGTATTTVKGGMVKIN